MYSVTGRLIAGRFSPSKQVEEVIGRKSEGDKVYFRVKWGGYSSKYNTWEPEENLSNCGDLIKEFMEKEANKVSRERGGGGGGRESRMNDVS